ncbi:hypothetical protein ACWDTM_32815, partial [Nocardia beijingensis]
ARPLWVAAWRGARQRAALDLYGHLFDNDLDPVADAMNRGALAAAADSLRTEGADMVAPEVRKPDLPAPS